MDDEDRDPREQSVIIQPLLVKEISREPLAWISIKKLLFPPLVGCLTLKARGANWPIKQSQEMIR